jgi:death-on-curing protein
MSAESFEYLTVADVLAIHEVIVESSDETTAGVSSEGDVEYALEHVESGHFGQQPESLHAKGFQLLRLLVANHPFVDGNKRTALAATVTFYALNGYDLDYDDEIRSILKRLGTDETAVEESEAVQYLRDCTPPPCRRSTTTRTDSSSRLPIPHSTRPSRTIITARTVLEAIMAADDEPASSISDLSPEEARRRLMRLIVRQDIDAHEEIYEALERE